MSIRYFLLLFFIPATLAAQLRFTDDQSIPVKDVTGNVLNNPWAGGINAPQFSSMDLNADGVQDLVLFDRMANKPVTFVRSGEKYVYSAAYEKIFPTDVTNWMLLRDYNCDGLMDIFSGDVLGIKVYTNTSVDGNVTWERYLFRTSSGGNSQVLLTKGFSSKVNLQLRFDDLPALADGDNDGDLDIFTIDFGSGRTIEYHKNFSKERYGTCDSLDFERVNDRWGNLDVCGCGSFAFGTDDCPTGGRVKHANGKSLLALDANGDSKMDLVLSDAACTNLYLLQQAGSPDNPEVLTSALFPEGHPVNFKLFPAAYYLDVDGDGTSDLISSPNIFAKDHDDINLRQSVWLYKNNGTNSQPDFGFVQEDFLQDQMIDVGDYSVPAFADVEGDGDYDLFISNNSGVNAPASIFVYENIGDQSSPSFQLLSTDYLSFSEKGFSNLKISFGDLDHDQRLDLIFTASSEADNLTHVYLLPGRSATVPDFQNREHEQVTFTLTGSETLLFHDVDEDGWTDVLAGRVSGKTHYWKNNKTDPVSFTLENDDYIPGSAARPFVALAAGDVDDDLLDDIILVDHTGIPEFISNYRDASNRSVRQAALVFNPLTQEFETANMGGRSFPAIVNLYHTTHPSIVFGNVLGGLRTIRNEDAQEISDDFQVDVYPSPLLGQQALRIRSNRNASLEVYNQMGQYISGPATISQGNTIRSAVSPLSAGVYIFRFQSGNRAVIRRIVVIN
jgi:hypothetical protein